MTEASSTARSRREAAAALLMLLAGGGLALLAGSRTWATLTVHRQAPLGPIVVDVAGRTLEPAVIGLAVVALAGVVAVLATRGRARTVMGVVLVVTGLGLIWPAAQGFAAVSPDHARRLVTDARAGLVLDGGQRLEVDTYPIWPIVTLVAALLVVLAALVIVIRGAEWTSMSARYERPNTRAGDEPVDPEAVDAARAKADLALWHSLERGEDPTA